MTTIHLTLVVAYNKIIDTKSSNDIDSKEETNGKTLVIIDQSPAYQSSTKNHVEYSYKENDTPSRIIQSHSRRTKRMRTKPTRHPRLTFDRQDDTPRRENRKTKSIDSVDRLPENI